ncbi:MAG: M48 family metalloprotease [Myxococcaceae bacterium]|nr:M48 family metalloprotease [Myxococcaceae bacterium]
MRLTLALVGVIAAAGPCANGPQLPGALGDAARSLNETREDAREVANASEKLKAVTGTAGDAVNRCDRLRTQDIALDEERTIGEAAAIQLAAANGGILIGRNVDDPANAPTIALNQLGTKLAALSERPHLAWTFSILDSDTVNAWSTPGGLVFVTRGLLKKVENEAQLAGVLAHEIAHVTGRHALNKYREVKVEQCRNYVAAGIAGKAASAVTSKLAASFGSDLGHLDFRGAEDVLANMGASVAAALQHEKFDPKQETQADYDAMSLLVLAGYQPAEYAKFLGMLPDTFQHDTHPPKQERIANVKSILNQFAKDPLRSPGAPYGPEQGYTADPISPALAAL